MDSEFLNYVLHAYYLNWYETHANAFPSQVHIYYGVFSSQCQQSGLIWYAGIRQGAVSLEL